MENHNLLLKLSRLFPSSFTSCQPRTRPDVIANSSVSIAKSKKSHRAPSESPLSPKHPKPESNSYSSPLSALCPPHAKGQKCPPASTGVVVRNQSSSSHSGRWFSSNDERTPPPADGFDTDTFYSMSSNSGDSFRAKASARKQLASTRKRLINETTTSRAKCDREKKSVKGCEPGSDHASTRTYYDDTGCRRRRRGAIEEGVAVEKKSSDPYGDFMGSMVEMITEKQMFGEEDLDRLLCCYLSLNKKEYHGIIFNVFRQICQTLLCN